VDAAFSDFKTGFGLIICEMQLRHNSGGSGELIFDAELGYSRARRESGGIIGIEYDPFRGEICFYSEGTPSPYKHPAYETPDLIGIDAYIAASIYTGCKDISLELLNR
jgi:hypothetical protein